MLKKFYILSFILLFLLSTTGLPLTLHLCDMQDSANLENCDMCSPKAIAVKTCCSENAYNSKISFVKQNDICCKDQLVDKKVKDEFFPKSDLKNFYTVSIVYVTFFENSSDISNNVKFITDNPPIPPGSGLIFLDNSLLLI